MSGSTGALFTPPLGSPGAIRAAAGRLKASTSGLESTSSAIRSAHTDLTGGGWGSDAGARFASFAGKVDKASARSAEPVSALSRVADAYADALDTAQRAIIEAKARYDRASATADQIKHQVNNDPDRTAAQVHTAQGQVDAADAQAQEAIDDAKRAWKMYDAARDEAAKGADSAGSQAEEAGESESGLAALMEKIEPERGFNEAFHSVWDGLALGSWIEHANRGLAEVAKGWGESLGDLAAQRRVWQATTEAMKALEATGAEVLPSLVAEADQAAAALSRTGGEVTSLARGLQLTKGLQVLGAASKVIDGAGILGDALTIYDPADKGAMGWVDRGAAGVNGTLLAANLAMDEIPVAGEVVMVGTGLYLAGDYLYHHWGAFHDACDSVGHTTVDLAKGAGHLASEGYHSVTHGLSSAAHWVGL